MKTYCWKCSQTIKLTKDGLIPKHRIRRGYRNQGQGMGGTKDLDICSYSGREGYIMDDGYSIQVKSSLAPIS